MNTQPSRNDQAINQVRDLLQSHLSSTNPSSLDNLERCVRLLERLVKLSLAERRLLLAEERVRLAKRKQDFAEKKQSLTGTAQKQQPENIIPAIKGNSGKGIQTSIPLSASLEQLAGNIPDLILHASPETGINENISKILPQLKKAA
ncbi:MAG: hypothetical protein SFY81_02890 [Verrucomicrobiota bacterium]|nr:hypothetical protein [Verrucomicrobiota bacterium]